MGVSVGGVFANNTDEVDLTGAFFQAGLFIMLSAMQNASSLVIDRPIFFKHYESNFYSALPFVLGRTMASFPQTISDVLLFGTFLYYIIGLAGRDDASNFFVYIAVLVTFAFTMQQQLAVFASFSSSSTLQVLSAVTLLYFILFGGYIVAPDIVPGELPAGRKSHRTCPHGLTQVFQITIFGLIGSILLLGHTEL